MKKYLITLTIFISIFSNAQDFSTIKKKDIFDVSGSIGTNLSFSDYSNRRSLQSPWAYTLSSSLNFKIAGISIPLSFAYANGDKRFTHPFVRFGLSPRYKNIRTHFGYRSMNLAPSIFSGKTFLGGGAEMNLGLFRFAGFYGFIEGNRKYTKEGYSSEYDRKAYGVKLGIGNNRYFFDIIAFKAKDDANKEKFKTMANTDKNALINQAPSISQWQRRYKKASYVINNSAAFNRSLHQQRLAKYGRFYADYQTIGATSSETQTFNIQNALYPQDNLALGANAGFTLFNRITIRSVFSMSGYTPNVNGQTIEGEEDLKSIAPLLEVRANSRLGYLSNTSISAQFNYFGFSINHRMVSNDYKTLGIENLTTNYTSSSVNMNSNLLEGKLSFNGFYSIYSNNFNKKQLYTSKRNSYGFNINTIFNDNLSISGNYNGLRSYQADGTQKVEESTKLDMSTHSFNFSPNYNINNENMTHGISLNFDYSMTINNNKETDFVEDSKNMLLSSSYSLSYIPLSLNTGLNYSYTKSWMEDMVDGGHSIGIFANKSFLKKKNLSVNASLNYGKTAYEQEVIEEGILKPIINIQNSFTASGGMRYTLRRRHHFSTNYTWSSSTGSGEKVFQNMFRAFFSYTYTLPTLSNYIYKKDDKKSANK